MKKRNYSRPTSRRHRHFEVERVEPRALLASFVVTTTADLDFPPGQLDFNASPLSLREAIELSDATPSTAAQPNRISFNLGAGTQAIFPLAALPTITQPTAVDATAPASNPTQVVELLGDQLTTRYPGTPFFGLRLFNGGSTVRGLVIGDFLARNSAGIAIFGGGNHLNPSDQGGSVVQSCDIGTDPAGHNIGNFYGIVITSSSRNTVGGTAPGAGNVISGNFNVGVLVSTDPRYGVADANLFQGNKVGVDPTGTKALANGGDGMDLFGSQDNTIGGTVPGSLNLVAGNKGNGVAISSDVVNGVPLEASGNVVQGNEIGTIGAIPDLVQNKMDGVLLNAASNNTIGGSVAGAGNVISGNAANGIEISIPANLPPSLNAATGNVISGNSIGVNILGTAYVPADLSGPVSPSNLGDGIRIDGSQGDASGNTIGGSTLAERNYISGNQSNGIELLYAHRALVEGNSIGIDGDGRIAIPNLGDGVLIRHSHSDTVGGTTEGRRNIISGNRADGIQIDGSAGNLVEGNYIGSDASGLTNIGNTLDGISVAFSGSNTIGGTTVAIGADGQPVNTSGNLIVANDASGLQFTDSADNLIQGNTIGLNVNSSPYAEFKDPGGRFGLIQNGVHANNQTGVQNPPQSPVITVPYAGKTPVLDGSYHLIGNGQDGISFNFFSGNNTVGGTAPGAANIISGNLKNGISLVNASDGNVVQANDIGTNGFTPATNFGPSHPAGTVAAGNGLNGIYVESQDNLIGGPGLGNVISGNAIDGVVLSGKPASRNVIQGNLIGTDYLGGVEPNVPNVPIAPQFGYDGLPIGNGSNGVMIINDSAQNSVGGSAAGAGNVISANGSNGVLLFDINYLSTDPKVPGNILLNNIIGLARDGSSFDGNGSDGVLINEAKNNIVGGPSVVVGAPVASGFGLNVISGNIGNGVEIAGPQSTGNVVQGDRIGTDIQGILARGNQQDGVLILNGTRNTIGGTAAAGNVISANTLDGVTIASDGIDPASGNEVSFNIIGLSANGSLPPVNKIAGLADPTKYFQGNIGDGVRLVSSGDNEVIRNNTISANRNIGVELIGPSTAAVVGNRIGTDVNGVISDGNLVGVSLNGAPNNTIGGPVGLGNLISGNANAGVQVLQGNAKANGFGVAPLFDQIEGNLIGTDATGTQGLGNGVGVFLNDVVTVTVGGPTPNLRNVISGNTTQGIVVSRVDNAAAGDAIQGNMIGPSAAGTPLSKGTTQQTGIFLSDAPFNTIGGLVATAGTGAGNVISGNAQDGISIFGQAVGADLNNTVQGNLIVGNGPTVPNSQSPPGVGIAISNSAGNLIGGTDAGAGNVVAGNPTGIEIAGSTNNKSGNIVQGNFVALNTFGVFINGSQYNSIGGATASAANVLSRNTAIGAAIVGPTSQFNTIQGNQINENGGPGSGAIPYTQDPKNYSTIGDGIFIDAASNNAVLGNAISGNGLNPNTQYADGVGVYLNDGAANNLISDTNIITRNTAYGVFLYNSAGNIDGVARGGLNAKKNLRDNFIADFREFTGPPPTGGATPVGNSMTSGNTSTAGSPKSSAGSAKKPER